VSADETFRSFTFDNTSDEAHKERVLETIEAARKQAERIARPSVIVFVHDLDKQQLHSHSGGRTGTMVSVLLTISKQIGGWLLDAERKRALENGHILPGGFGAQQPPPGQLGGGG
jgi:hypothetical protein